MARSDSADLSSTAYVILGLLDAEPRTGYEIKQAVDNSTRFFWAASYGQIYPELRRLRDAGLVESERDDAGARQRSRHRITAAGRRELKRWLATPAADCELRDEKLLKLFFARSSGKAGTDSAVTESTAAELMTAKAEEHSAKAERLRELEPRVIAAGNPYQLMVLRYGIGLNEWSARYCADAAGDLANGRGGRAPDVRLPRLARATAPQADRDRAPSSSSSPPARSAPASPTSSTRTAQTIPTPKQCRPKTGSRRPATGRRR